MKTNENNAAKSEIVKALIQFKKSLVQPKKDGVNPHFKSRYVTLDAVVDAVDKAMEKTGLIYTQMTQFKDGDFVLITTIMHESGESISGSYVLPAVGKPQEIGSALTYARRYALCAALGVVADEDDDGNTAAEVKSGDDAMFERDKKWILACDDVAALKTYYDGVRARKDKFSAEQYSELVTITTNKSKSLKGEL